MTNDPQAQVSPGEADTEEPPNEMAALLEASLDYRSPERGEIVEGEVMGWDRDGAIIDVGFKSEGVVLRHEMHSLGANPESQLQAGEKVLVYIVQSETAEGQVLLSIDRARGERGWRVLQDRFESGESFEGEVTGFNRGGLLVNVEGVNAFVPLSQVVGVRPDRGRDDGGGGLAEQVGRKLRLKVIEINSRRNRVILSERAALQECRMQQKARLIQELHEGDIRRGRVSSVRSFGVFIDLGGADGLAHLSELSWERGKSPDELFKVGDEVDVYVTKIDAENKKIALSLRRANPAQWDAVVDTYHEGQVVTGLVTKLVTFGAFARIEGPVEGLIHVSELVDRRIERNRHRLGLSLRHARDEGEALGFVFSEGGEVLSVPEDVRNEFVAREGPLPEVTEEEPKAAAVAPVAEAAIAEAPVAAEKPVEASASEEEPKAAAVEPVAEATTVEAPVAAEAPAEAPANEEEPKAEAPETDSADAATVEAPVATEEPAEESAAEEEQKQALEEADAAIGDKEEEDTGSR